MDSANVYLTHINKPPNYTNMSIKSIEKSKQEYAKLLNDKSSKASTIKPNKPLGRIFLQDSKTLCTDVSSGTAVPRYNIINVRKDKGFISSAMADLTTATSSAIDYATKNSSPKCMRATILEVNETGSKLQNTQYISLADLRDADPEVFPNKKRPYIPEGFQDIADEYEITMDAGQRFFVGSVAVLGLYMYYRLVYGRK